MWEVFFSHENEDTTNFGMYVSITYFHRVKFPHRVFRSQHPTKREREREKK